MIGTVLVFVSVFLKVRIDVLIRVSGTVVVLFLFKVLVETWVSVETEGGNVLTLNLV